MNFRFMVFPAVLLSFSVQANLLTPPCEGQGIDARLHGYFSAAGLPDREFLIDAHASTTLLTTEAKDVLWLTPASWTCTAHGLLFWVEQNGLHPTPYTARAVRSEAYGFRAVEIENVNFDPVAIAKILDAPSDARNVLYSAIGRVPPKDPRNYDNPNYKPEGLFPALEYLVPKAPCEGTEIDPRLRGYIFSPKNSGEHFIFHRRAITQIQKGEWRDHPAWTCARDGVTFLVYGNQTPANPYRVHAVKFAPEGFRLLLVKEVNYNPAQVAADLEDPKKTMPFYFIEGAPPKDPRELDNPYVRSAICQGTELDPRLQGYFSTDMGSVDYIFRRHSGVEIESDMTTSWSDLSVWSCTVQNQLILVMSRPGWGVRSSAVRFTENGFHDVAVDTPHFDSTYVTRMLSDGGVPGYYGSRIRYRRSSEPEPRDPRQPDEPQKCEVRIEGCTTEPSYPYWHRIDFGKRIPSPTKLRAPDIE